MSAERRQAILRYQHQADSWPFDYSMEQRFRLTSDRLEVELLTKNRGDQVMPYGFGIHPYFPRTPNCRLFAQVTGMWENDNEVMPVRHRRDHIELNGHKGMRIAESNLDNVFTGWAGRAEIHWPENATKLEILATGNLNFLVVYSPQSEEHFCVEPVSNCTDAFNLYSGGMRDTGLMEIEPGETISAKVSFSPQRIG